MSARRGADACLSDVASSGDATFVEWARVRMGPRAVYVLSEQAPYPDRSCLAIAFLPALPAGPGDRHPGWEVVIGGFPAALRSLIAEHDPRVHVFGPGFALVRARTE